jgi:hypothetical protein
LSAALKDSASELSKQISARPLVTDHWKAWDQGFHRRYSHGRITQRAQEVLSVCAGPEQGCENISHSPAMRSRECPLKLREERVHAYDGAIAVTRGRETDHGLDQAPGRSLTVPRAAAKKAAKLAAPD